MPLIAWWGVAAVLSGFGIKMAGDGVEDSSNGVRDLVIAGAALGAVYLMAKDRGLI